MLSLNDFTPTQVVKAYTHLLKVARNEPNSELDLLLAKLPIDPYTYTEGGTLEDLAATIRQWCVDVKNQERTVSIERALVDYLGSTTASVGN